MIWLRSAVSRRPQRSLRRPRPEPQLLCRARRDCQAGSAQRPLMPRDVDCAARLRPSPGASTPMNPDRSAPVLPVRLLGGRHPGSRQIEDARLPKPPRRRRALCCMMSAGAVSSLLEGGGIEPLTDGSDSAAVEPSTTPPGRPPEGQLTVAVFMLGWQDPAPAPPHASRAPPPLPAAVGRAASGTPVAPGGCAST